MSTAHRLRRTAIPALLVVAFALGGVVATATPASAATITVTTEADSYPLPPSGSLRAAIYNSSPGDEIVFDPSITEINVVSPIEIEHGVTITGAGSSRLTILGGLSFLPKIAHQDFSVSGVTFKDNGNSQWSMFITGAVYKYPRDVSLHDVIVEGYSQSGVLVALMDGSLQVTDSVFRDNTTGSSGGGGMVAATIQGDVSIRDTVFDSNTAPWKGGGLSLQNVHGTTALERVTFANNSAGTLGGGLAFEVLDDLTIVDSTFRDNIVTAGDGGGIGSPDVTGNVTITGSSFIGNSTTGGELAGSALFAGEVSGVLALHNTSVMGNISNDASSGFGVAVGMETLESGAHVLISGSTFADNANVGGGDMVGAGSVGVGVVEEGATVDVWNSTFREATDESLSIAVLIGGSEGDITVSHSTLESFIGILALFTGDPNDPDPLPGTFLIENSILSRAAVLPEGEDIPNLITIAGAFDISHNLFTGYNETELYNDLGGNQFRVDPLLGPLQDNGGPTLTMMPRAGSPAIDAGTPGAVTPEFDQRGVGFDRVLAGRVDVGAVETPAILPATGQTIPVWIPIVGGVLLVGGLGAVVATAVRGRGGRKPPTE